MTPTDVNDVLTVFRNMPDDQLLEHIKDTRAARARIVELEAFIRALGDCKSSAEVYGFVISNYDKVNIPEIDDEEELDA